MLKQKKKRFFQQNIPAHSQAADFVLSSPGVTTEQTLSNEKQHVKEMFNLFTVYVSMLDGWVFLSLRTVLSVLGKGNLMQLSNLAVGLSKRYYPSPVFWVFPTGYCSTVMRK